MTNQAPPKISCNIGEAMLRTPMPAETFRQSTAQINQNCGVLCASLRATSFVVIMPLRAGRRRPARGPPVVGRDAIAERAGPS